MKNILHVYTIVHSCVHLQSCVNLQRKLLNFQYLHIVIKNNTCAYGNDKIDQYHFKIVQLYIIKYCMLYTQVIL